MSRMAAKVVLVSNEVWSGIVPDNALARRFRDIAGTLNQRIAGVTTQVDLVAWAFLCELRDAAPRVPSNSACHSVALASSVHDVFNRQAKPGSKCRRTIKVD